MGIVREIKYRAWDKHEKRMGQVVGIDFQPFEARVNFSPDNEYEFFDDPEDVGLLQYTGLKDKNGKEIYEGDVLKSASGVQFVEWHFNRWLLKRNGRKEEFNRLDFQAGFFEIIGNIYENPELLAQENGSKEEG